ncbi:MAG: hypothetical protein ACXWID_19160, partial [Pyrinomonadaceae bacterium]
MKDRLNHRGPREPLRAKRKEPRANSDGSPRHDPRFALRTLPFAVLLLCVLCGETSFAQPQPQAQAASERHRYDIQLTLDFDKRNYTGTERVRFVNRGTRATSTLYFHLYSNLRVPGYLPPKKTESGEVVSDEPR